MRRILIIIGGLLLLLAVGIALYFIFFRGSAIIVDQNPFGSAGDRDPGSLGPVIDTNVPTSGAGTVIAPRLLKIADGPVAKGTISLYTPPKTITATSTGTSTPAQVVQVPEETEVRYIDRQSGNVYSFKVHERVVTRLSNKTLPGIIEATWARDGSRAFVRFLERDAGGGERVSTYILPSGGEGGFFLEQGLSQILVASTTAITLLSSDSGSVATLMNTDGTNSRTLFSSMLSRLRVGFLGTSYLAQTKATAHLDGYAFQVSSGGVFTRLLGPLRGLSTLPSPSGGGVLYSYVDRGRVYTQVLNVSDRTTVPLPLATLPEKCVWTLDSTAMYCAVPTALTGLLPDEWYQGARTFNDRVWRIDLATRVATLVFDPRQLGDVSIDAEALAVDVGDDVLVFMNRTDGSLWSYDL